MKVKTVGIKEVDFKNNDGQEVHGANLYYVREPLDNEVPNTIGQVADKLWIPSTSRVFGKLADLDLGETELVYDFNGRYATLVDIRPL